MKRLASATHSVGGQVIWAGIVDAAVLMAPTDVVVMAVSLVPPATVAGRINPFIAALISHVEAIL